MGRIHLRIPLSSRLRRPAVRLALLVAVGVLVAGCSAVKLAYHQAPQLAYWQLNRYFELSEPQAELARAELDALHQWHRDSMLAHHARLLQAVQQQLLSGSVTAELACSVYAQGRTQLDQVLDAAVPRFARLAQRLNGTQIRHLQKRQADSNADWRKEWLEPGADALREHRVKRLASRVETFYGPLQPPQKALLQSLVAQSSWDAQRSYAERLRRQQDLVQVLHQIAADPANTPVAEALLRGFLARMNTSPNAAYQRHAQALLAENCDAFARVHSAMSAPQRERAVQVIKGYEQDFGVLAAR